MIKIVTTLLLALSFAANANTVSEPWETRELFDTRISVDVPSSYRVVRRATRSILIKSVPEKIRIDINIDTKARDLSKAVTSVLSKGKKKGWEVEAFNFYERPNRNLFGRIIARIPIKRDEQVTWYKSMFQMINFEGKTVMTNYTALESDFDKEAAERVLSSVQYEETEVKPYTTDEGEFGKKLRGVKS